jgi:hypothetical protein
MVKRTLFAIGLAALQAAALLLAPTTTSAQAPPTPPSTEPAIHHAPVSVAKAGEQLTILAAIDHPEMVRSAFVVYRIGGAPDVHEVRFLRAAQGPYIAIIPEGDVRSPSIGYTVELEPLAGSRKAAFASRDEMQQVEVPGDLEDARERALAARLDNRRSVVSTTTEYVVFGQRSVDGGRAVGDRYWRAEASYTYRPLRMVAEFGIRAGVVRGPNPSPDPTKPDLGLNYGAPSIRLRLGDIWHVEGEFLTSVTASGFSVGSGAALLIGDPYGSKLTLGFESIQGFGSRVYSRVDIAARRNLVISPIVEVTDAVRLTEVSQNKFGVRLLTEARFALGGGFGVNVLGGYQARVAASGGPTLGLSGSYAF